jgi:hypothetical protein
MVKSQGFYTGTYTNTHGQTSSTHIVNIIKNMVNNHKTNMVAHWATIVKQHGETSSKNIASCHIQIISEQRCSLGLSHRRPIDLAEFVDQFAVLIYLG